MSAVKPMVHFDHHSEEFATNRDAIADELRSKCPVSFTEAHGGYWVISSYPLVKEVLGSPDRFSSEKNAEGTTGGTIPPVGPRLIPAECDPPYHTGLRRALNPKFTRQAAQRVRPQAESIVRDLVDEIVEKGDFDVVADVANVLPSMLTVMYLGFPVELRPAFITHVTGTMAAVDPSPEAQAAAAASFEKAAEMIMDYVAARRAEPTDDLVSYLVTHEDPVFDDQELLWLIFTVLVGGLGTMSGMIAHFMIHLAEDRELRDRLMADPSLIPAATDEFIRFYSPATGLARTVVKDDELGGMPLAAGDRLLVLLPAANHDENVFPQGSTFDVDQASRAHLDFGYGPHFCLGAWLARLELDVLCAEILRRIPDYVVHLDRARRAADCGIVYAWETVPASVQRSGDDAR
jgi:cytochrome P450